MIQKGDYGIGNKNIGKRIMEINSVFLEDNVIFFKEALNGFSGEDILTKKIKKHKEKHFTAECFLKLSKHINIISTNFHLKKMITDKFSVSGEFVMVSCVFKGESQLTNKLGKHLELGQVFLSYFTESSEDIKMPASRTRYICILISSRYYLKLLENERWVTKDTFFQKVATNSFVPLGKFSIPLGFQLQQIAKDMIDCDWNPARQLDYLQLKLKELFLQLHYQNEEQKVHLHYKISNSNLKKLEIANAYLMVNYKNPPTVKALSRIILLNEAELKKGFKQVFGKTIRSYVIELRMKKAGDLIKNYTVNDVAGILGYKSVPHFINTFKKYYGVTPKQLF